MAKTLKLTPSVFNSYEEARNLLSGSPFYSNDLWLYSARHDSLDMYMTTLINDKELNMETLQKDYGYDFADAKLKLASLQNELFADKTTLKDRERLKVDENGQPILSNGEYQWETYQTNDYDYFKGLIKSNTDVLYNDYLRAQEVERKESMNGFVKFMAGMAGALVLEPLEGTTRFIDDITGLIHGVAQWIQHGFDSDKFVEGVASDDFRLFESLGFQDWVVDFESKYSWMRDLDGSYTNVGKIIGGVANSLGYMAPTMLLSMATSGAGGAASSASSSATGASSALSSVGRATSQLVFYSGMASGNIKDMYEHFARQGVSVSSGQIVCNAALKSLLQWAVEVGLSKIMGTTSLDSLLYGKQYTGALGKISVGSKAKNLSAYALQRVLKDAYQEGLEEVLQDTSDFLVDRAFMKVIDEEFGNITTLSMESLMDAFIIGAISSFAGSARQVISAKRVDTGEIKTDKVTGEALTYKYGKHKGEAKTRKLTRLSSWAYGLNMQSFMSNYEFIKNSNWYDVTTEQLQVAEREMYTALRLLSSAYGEIGEQRFRNADAILTSITNRINAGEFDRYVDEYSIHRLDAELMYKQIFGDEELTDIAQATAINSINKLAQAKLDKVVAEYQRDSEGEITIPDELEDAFEQIIKRDKSVNKIVITENGIRPVAIDDVIFAPLNLARNSSGSMIYDTIAEQTLVETTIAGDYKISLDEVLKTYKEASGLENATLEEAIYNLYFNDSFYRIMLYSSTRDMYQLLSSLITLEKNIVADTLRDESYKSKISNVTTWMRKALEEYCINQQNADINLDVFDTATVNRIRKFRWCKDLYTRVVTNEFNENRWEWGKLSKDDVTILTNRVNGMPVSQKEKDKILTNLKSKLHAVRIGAMNAINAAYNNVFKTPYNGEIYMPTNSVANQVFNNFLLSHGLTIQTVLDYNSLTEAEIEVLNSNYGGTDTDNILKYRNSQFAITCNSKFKFAATLKNDRYVAAVFNTEGKQVGYSTYATNLDKVIVGDNIEERTFVTVGKNYNEKVRALLSDEVDIATASYLTIDDVINNPDCLKVDLLNDIKAKYGDLNTDSVFLYLRQYFLDNSDNHNITVMVNQDGRYIFGDVSQMLSILKKGTINFNTVDENTKITDLVKSKYLYGRARNVNIKLTDDANIVASYSYKTEEVINGKKYIIPDNTIYINRELLKTDPNLAKFAFLHEFQHCIQVENKMNLGLDADWINKISKTLRNNIIADVKSHRPELFEGVTDNKQIAKIVNDFVYHTSGESMAYGMEASEKMDFYPTLVAPDVGRLTLSLPWGSKFDLFSKNNYSSITATAATTDKRFKEIKRYTDVFFNNYNSKTIDKGFIFPNGDAKFFSPIKTHREQAESVAFSLDDYLSGLAYMFNGIEITTDMYNFDERRYLSGNFGKYTVRLPSDINYMQKETLLKFIEQARKDGKVVELWDWGGLAHASTSGLSKYDTAEDMYKKFMKRYNVTPIKKRENRVGRLSFDYLQKFERYLDNYKLSSLNNLDKYNTIAIDTRGNVYSLPENFDYNLIPDELKSEIPIETFNFLLETCFIVRRDIDGNYATDDYSFGANENQLEVFTDVYLQLKKAGKTISHYDQILEDNDVLDAVNASYRFALQTYKISTSFISNASMSIFPYEDSQFLEYQGYVLDDLDRDYIKEVQRTNVRVNEESTAKETNTSMLFPARTPMDSTTYAVSFSDLESTERRIEESTKPETTLGKMGFAKPIDKPITTPTEEVEEATKKATEKKPSRQVSQKKAQGTNLIYFTGKYKQVQMAPELQEFIKSTTGKRNVDPRIMDKINGKEKGTLTYSDVMHYLATADTINKSTFKLINNAFFKNKVITTFDELLDYVNNKTDKYYAARAVLRESKWGETLLDRIDSPEIFEQVLTMIENDKTIKPIFDDILLRYSTYKGQPIAINDNYTRILWLKYFDGSFIKGGYIASITKYISALQWDIAYGLNKKTRSLDANINGEDSGTFAEMVEDTEAMDAFNELFKDEEDERTKKESELYQMLARKVIKEAKAEAKTMEQYRKIFTKKMNDLRTQISNFSDDKLEKEYINAWQRELIQEERYIEKFGKNRGLQKKRDVELAWENEMINLLNYIDEQNTETSGRGYVSRIRSFLRTISKNLSEKERTLFLRQNSDIVDENFHLKREVIFKNPKEKYTKKLEYKDTDTLKALLERVSKLSHEVRLVSYNGKYKDKYIKDLEKKVEELKAEYTKLLTSKNPVAVTYEIGTTTLHIDATKEMPNLVKRFLNTNFTKVAKSTTQELTTADDYHIRMSMEDFIKEHAETLQSMTQSDVDEILDFYYSSDVLSLTGTNATAKYKAVQIYLMTYILRGNKLGQFVLTEEQYSELNSRLEDIVRNAGMQLQAWRKAKQYLDPEKALLQSLARSNKLEFSEESMSELIAATDKFRKITDKNSPEYKEASQRLIAIKQKMYEEGVKLYKGRPQTVWDKLLKFETAAMLSGPGTWLRNISSNVTIRTSNELIDFFAKFFPTKKGLKVEQYKIAGTVISDDVKNFINNTFKTPIGDSKLTLLDLLSDGFTKYDPRKATKNDALDNLSLRIMNAIEIDVFGKIHTDRKGKLTNELTVTDKMYGFVFKMLSDKKFVQSAALSYFGKILTETKADLSKGLSDNDIVKYLCDAFVMASHDYMHKTNIFTQIDEVARNWPKPAYFLYKQIMPFASTGWNWFVEGLRYTPLGLVQACVKLAKLENTIEKVENKLQKGEQVPDSRFTEYLIRRNIGKGVIGTIGFIIGGLLAGFGVARIDEEDDKYKLYINDVAIDISDLFGTQGIFLGISIIGAFKNSDDLDDALATVLDNMFRDSVFSDLFNLFRYNSSVGDWLLYMPEKMINMFLPNFLKTLSDIVNVYDVKFNEGIVGKLEKLAVNALPGLAYAFPKRVDPYTGETQTTYKAQFVVDFVNKLAPFKIYPYNVSDLEKRALEVGVKKSELTGRYEINGEKVHLKAADVEKVNQFYGELNNKELSLLMNDKKRYRVYNEKTKAYEEKTYSKMTEKQKATVIERIMSNNGGYAKIYILTQNGYKYYASEAEYKTLKSLGIDCYKATDKKKGFYKV